MAPDPDDIQALIERRGPGDRQALFGDLFMRHRLRLKRMVEMRIDPRLRGRFDSSDVLQETYLEASRRLDGFLANPEVPLYIWVRFLAAQRLQILHRQHLGKERDARRDITLDRNLLPGANSECMAIQILAGDPSPSGVAQREEMRSRLERALEEMEPLDREVIALRHFEHLSHRETSLVLGIEAEAVRKRYYRALVKLKDLLDEIPGRIVDLG